jgi:hypothetical protein
MHVAPIRTEVDDRVADKLTGTVIGDISAAPRLVDFYPTLRQKLTAGEDVRTPAVAFDAKRQHMRVLHEQEDVLDVSRSTLLDQLALERQRLGVRNQPGTADD